MRWFIAVVIGALIGFLFAAFFWPWCGPLLFTPCPQFTRAGVVVAALTGALAAIGVPYPLRWRVAP